MYKCKFVLILFFITFPFFSYSNESATGIIKERMEKFQESKNLMRTINKNLSGNNFNVISQSAEKLNKWANEMHEFFPKGSDASAKLIKISKNKNIDDTVSSFREVAASCKGCHQKFRN